MPPKIKKRVAKKSLVCWNKEGKTICAGKSTFTNYKKRKVKKVVKKAVVKKAVVKKAVVKKAVVKKAVVKKAVVKKAVVKKAVVKKAVVKKDFAKEKKNILANIPLAIYGTGMTTMSGDDAEKAISNVKRTDDWESMFKKIKAKIKDSSKYYFW